MRFPKPVHRFVASSEAPARGTARMRQPPPSIALRGPIRSSTEGPSGSARMRLPHPLRHVLHALRGPIGNSTAAPTA
eukprot:6005647-Pyramimonas_sp.AAC.1